MLYTDFYQLILSATLQDEQIHNKNNAQAEEVRELFFQCDPLGEGWIFPRVVSEYIKNRRTKSIYRRMDSEW